MSIGSALIKSIVTVLFAGLIIIPTDAQVVQAGRLEIPLANNEGAYTPLGLENNGLMLYRLVGDRQEPHLQLLKLDTALHESWKGFVKLQHSARVLKVKYNNDNAYFLCKDVNNISGDFSLIIVSMNSDYKTFPIKNVIAFSPSEFSVTDEAAFIGGYYNLRPFVLYFNFESLHANILPGFFDEPGQLNQLKTYPDGTADVVVVAKNLEKRKSVWIKNYSAKGELLKTVLIQPGEEKNLLFGRSVRLPNGHQIVAGVYGKFAEFSRGIFVTDVSIEGEYSTKYYNFAEFKNFFSYMKAAKQRRIKERIDRRTIRGQKIKFNYLFLVHDIIPYEGQYIMTGEAFYPRYKSSTYGSPYGGGYGYGMPSYSAYGGPSMNAPLMRSNGMIFDGYQYTHAVVVGFDADGKIRWDNSFEINDYRSMNLKESVHVSPEQDKIVMTYLYQNAVRSKIIRDSEVLEGKSKDQIKPSFDSEVVDVKSIQNEQLETWYGNFMYASGTTQLKRGASSRHVFFINKININGK